MEGEQRDGEGNFRVKILYCNNNQILTNASNSISFEDTGLKKILLGFLFNFFSLNYSALFSGQEGQVGRHSHADGDQRTSFWTQPPLFSNVVA